jgi:hypothetical protein
MQGGTALGFHGAMHARAWSQPNPPILQDPDPFLLARLRLTDAWKGAAGWVAIGDEPTTGLWSILGYLRWHARALMATDRGCSTRDVDAWLDARPLVAAIDAELARRGEIDRGQALATLRAIGLAPWERP